MVEWPAHPFSLPFSSLAEVELANSLMEDQNNDAMSYVDYVSSNCLLTIPSLLPSSLTVSS